ncbi:hypothetical protein OD350_12685 [Clostridium beijerinckii]|uniref:hypothetical protein n=1 Tax=Clostridium beijerinckii TaxID=1520 RepID=UPI0015706A57|nr:hypothetical protein [Clostridium beijerinckii]NRT35858.1 flagellar hook assembly protein FlgD [Clostridium beijerinckii]NRT44716.1 flagellar hook assembly protein FlgD [Clostridium beijerinckii]NRZ21292.1 flagellar hook assembly protein FlgD [Clostridium beijerinckii]UYZ38484.1 hypothetical protein OD350_12685 [Clostridium beijerinckii]
MKKALGIAAVSVVVFVIGIFLYKTFSDFAYLGSVSQNITSNESSNSESTFNAKKGENIKFNCNSLVEEGSLKLTLTDSSGKVIRNFESNKNYSEQVTFENDGEYRLSATYDNFIGNLHVKFR